MSSSPTNRSFYKYMSPETTLAVLRSGKVRYSSQVTFNDPFDVQSGLHFDFSLSSLHDKFLDRLAELAQSPNEPLVNRDDPWGKVVLEAWKHYRGRGFSRDRWASMTIESFNQVVCDLESFRCQYEAHWSKTLVPNSRVFCVSEDGGNLLMWAHYAKDHTGSLFEFKSLPSEDNPLSVAQPIEYVESPPAFFSEAEFVDDLTGVKKLDSDRLYKRYAFFKSSKWSYEREWRVWYPELGSGREFSDMPIRPSEFASIVLGCRAESGFREIVAQLVRRSFPNTEIFRARKVTAAYELKYDEVP